MRARCVHLRRKRHQSLARKPNHFRCRNALAPARFWWTLTGPTDANTTATLRRSAHVASQLMPPLCFRFINARRRIVQPMIDQSNRAGKWRRRTVAAPSPSPQRLPCTESSGESPPFGHRSVLVESESPHERRTNSFKVMSYLSLLNWNSSPASGENRKLECKKNDCKKIQGY